MSQLQEKLSDRDLAFAVETVFPQREDKPRLMTLLREDADILDQVLNSDRLYERFAADPEILVQVSPRLLFAVLLRQAAEDLQTAAYTIEHEHQQRIPVFDADRVADFLQETEFCDYLADMLATFTKIQTYSLAIRVRQGVWHRLRFNDMDIDGLIRYAQALEEPQRFACYKRIADVCLFLAGLFPEHAYGQARYPLSGQIRPRWFRGQQRRTLDEYQREGERFYKMAAQHEAAVIIRLGEVLEQLSRHFLEAQKSLSYLAQRYLWFDKRQFFGAG